MLNAVVSTYSRTTTCWPCCTSSTCNDELAVQTGRGLAQHAGRRRCAGRGPAGATTAFAGGRKRGHVRECARRARPSHASRARHRTRRHASYRAGRARRVGRAGLDTGATGADRATGCAPRHACRRSDAHRGQRPRIECAPVGGADERRLPGLGLCGACAADTSRNVDARCTEHGPTSTRHMRSSTPRRLTDGELSTVARLSDTEGSADADSPHKVDAALGRIAACIQAVRSFPLPALLPALEARAWLPHRQGADDSDATLADTPSRYGREL